VARPSVGLFCFAGWERRYRHSAGLILVVGCYLLLCHCWQHSSLTRISACRALLVMEDGIIFVKKCVEFNIDCMHVALANLLSEIIMARDGFLSLPTWFSRDLIDDVISSVCV